MFSNVEQGLMRRVSTRSWYRSNRFENNNQNVIYKKVSFFINFDNSKIFFWVEEKNGDFCFQITRACHDKNMLLAKRTSFHKYVALMHRSVFLS